mmetsp:Transcript_42458/g.85432  ORF Transcript_42458/g.85432 Transcript_42458/m.85432 type:complete len:220 (-) Transcript_42458:69-728(-)
MSIVYSLISRGVTVFCEYTGQTGNFVQISRDILEKVEASNDSDPTFNSYTYDDHVFHMIIHHGVYYVAMATKDLERRIAYAFLEDIKAKFDEKYSDVVNTAVAYEMNKTFGKVLVERMEFYNSNPEADKVRKVRGEVDEVRQVMVENIERILDRGDKIELLVDKSEDLSAQASKFKRSAGHLQRRMWWANCRVQTLIVGSVSVVILLIVLGATKCFGQC